MAACAAITLAAKPVHKIKLDNGLTMAVEFCKDDIFRISISTQNSFPEALLNRYGVVKTDFSF